MKSKFVFLFCIVLVIVLIALKYIIGLPFNDYLMTIILLIIAMVAGYSLCSITENHKE